MDLPHPAPAGDVALTVRPHWMFLLPPYAAAAAATVLLGAAVWATAGPAVTVAAVAVTLTAAAYTAWRILVWRCTSFTVTDRRLIHRTGVINRTTVEIPLERINTVLLRRNLFERIVGAGDLIFESASEQGRQTINDIPDPETVRDVIHRLRDADRRPDDDPFGGGHCGGAASGVVGELERLGELRRRGDITDDEHARLKRRIVDGV